MKTLIAIVILVQCSFTAYSCSCYPLTFCELFEELEVSATPLIFKGTYISEEQIGADSRALKFKVEEIYKGEIVTENSEHYTGEEFINTDTTVWVLSGPDGVCLRYLNESTAIFAVEYTSFNGKVGYAPSICRSDYFPISSDDEVTGWILDSQSITMSLEEFEPLLKQGCMISSVMDSADELQHLNIFPNPVNEVLNIEAEYYGNEIQMELYDTKGKLIKRIEESSVDMSELSPGIYFFIAHYRNSTYTKKVVKI